MIGTLSTLDAGGNALAGIKTRQRRDGQAVARVYPTNIYERLLLHGYEVDVWMQPDVEFDELSRKTARFYRSPDHDDQVTPPAGRPCHVRSRHSIVVGWVLE